MNLINMRHKAHLFLVLISTVLISACANNQKGEQTEQALPQSLESSQLAQKFKQGVELVEQSRFDEAKIILDKLHQTHPQILGPMLNLGHISIKQQDFEAGKAYYLKSLQLKPKHIGALISLAYIAREEGRFDEAENYYRQVFEIEPNNLMALKNLGILLDLYRGRLRDALVLYEQYQLLQKQPDTQIKDWIFDIKSRIEVES